MNTRSRLAYGTALLLVVVGAASGLAWFAVVKRGAERKAAAARTKRVLGFEPAQVTALRVRARGDDVRLERSAGAAPGTVRWRIVAHVVSGDDGVSGAGGVAKSEGTEEADGAEVAALLSRLAALERRAQSAAAGESQDRLRVYGLDAPTARFDLELEGGRTATLALGSDTGFDGTMFVMPTSGEVLVVESRARLGLERTASELRERPRPPASSPPARAPGPPLPSRPPGG